MSTQRSKRRAARRRFGPISIAGRILSHISANAVAYVALFAALGGTSYAAFRLAPGSVTSKALANGAVTHAKLARGSVTATDIAKHSLTVDSFKAGVFRVISGSTGATGPAGMQGAAGGIGALGGIGPMGPAGKDGSSSVVMSGLESGSVTAPHGSSTDVPLSNASWTQAGNDVNLILGSMSVGIPSSCTGSFGNALSLLVDGIPTTFGVVPTIPASTTVTVPFVVSEIMEPGTSTHHTITAKLANTCTKSGEDFTISNVKVDVVNFH